MKITSAHCQHCTGNIAYDSLDQRYFCLQCGRDTTPGGQPLSQNDPRSAPSKNTGRQPRREERW